MKSFKGIFIGLGLVAGLGIMHAQFAAQSFQDVQPIGEIPDSIVQIAAEGRGLLPIAPQDLPRHATYWLILPSARGNAMAPLPFAPTDAGFMFFGITSNQILVDGTGNQVILNTRSAGLQSQSSLVAVALETQASAVVNLIEQILGAEARQQAIALGVPTPGDGEGGSGDFTNNYVAYTFDTNQLWLAITNIANGTVFANLHHATNQVYAIWGATNLLTGWQVETAVWPTNAEVMPFTVPTLGREILFLRAQDWTGVDANTNGVPDIWEWRYWGSQNLNYSMTNLDYSDNGLTFAEDYSNNIPPTVFSFTGVSVTNNYVHSSAVPVTLDVSGAPYYVAVLVDDANLSNAVWQTYSSPNVPVNLGITQGWHEVWIGLRGHADDASDAVWQWQRLKLDTVSPPLVITGPTNNNGNVTVPLIQLTGYSAEKLSRIHYDLSNADGVVTNQLTLITGQSYNTNTAEFTTNQFHAYDVPLTEGLNVLTLHATDMAGNVTTLTTNLTCTLPTTPPTVGMGWPLTGWQVSGTNLTLRGQTTDPTATVSVSVVGDEGETNELGGLVGRDGILWVENVPLHAGTNQLWLTVANAMGSTTTNLTLIRSLTNLTINSPVNAGQVHVDGSIDTGGYTIWVNGIETTPTNGTWSADITPIGIGGGLVEVTAIPNTDTVMPGGPGQNPDSTNALHAQVTVAAPSGVFVSAYHHHDHETIYALEDEANANPTTCDTILDWADGAGGFSKNARLSYFGNSLITGRSDALYWPASHWPGAFPAATWEDVIYGSGGYTNINTNIAVAPELVLEHCCDQRPLTYFAENKGWASRTADTEMKLATGGPLGSKQMNLWCISAVAADGDTGLAIPPQRIEIGAFGHLDTNGNLWVVLPDNDPDTITLMVQGNDYYKTHTLTAVKYTLTTSWPGGLPITNVQEVVVGQKISLTCQLLDDSGNPPPAPYAITNYEWTVPGYAISNYIPTWPSGVVYKDFPTNQAQTTFYWRDAVHQTVQCDIALEGQQLTTLAEFTVLKPNITLDGDIGSSISVDTNYVPGTNWLHFGYKQLPNCGVVFAIFDNETNSAMFGPSHELQFAQTGIVHRETLFTSGTNWITDKFGIDGVDTNSDWTYNKQAIAIDPTTTRIFSIDSPGNSLADISAIRSKAEDVFTMHLMYKHISEGSIYVPLQSITWSWSATATNLSPNTTYGSWLLTATNYSVSLPPNNTPSFPVWNSQIPPVSSTTHNP